MGIIQVAISQIEVLATPPNNKELNLAQSQSTIEENAEPLSISIYLENWPQSGLWCQKNQTNSWPFINHMIVYTHQLFSHNGQLSW